MKIEVIQNGRKIAMDIEGEDQTLQEMIYAFDDVLHALGYVYDGCLTIVEDKD